MNTYMSLHLPYTRYTCYMGSCRLFAVYCLGKHCHSWDVLKVKMQNYFRKIHMRLIARNLTKMSLHVNFCDIPFYACSMNIPKLKENTKKSKMAKPVLLG